MLDERFWSKVRRGPAEECWEWTANKNNKGYGMFSWHCHNTLAHRLAYEEANGHIPRGRHILHRCDNPSCVNPVHLFLGTHHENMLDKEAKRRGNHVGQAGTKNPNARLTDSQVVALRRDYIAGVDKDEICHRYGVSINAISDYTGGRSWAHLLGVDGAPSLAELKAAARKHRYTLINANQVLEIRKRLAAGEMGIALAAEYGIHKATVSDIKLRKIWADI